jgi:hypothetical protein
MMILFPNDRECNHGQNVFIILFDNDDIHIFFLPIKILALIFLSILVIRINQSILKLYVYLFIDYDDREFAKHIYIYIFFLFHILVNND